MLTPWSFVFEKAAVETPVLVLVADLEGFTRVLSTPDVHLHVPHLLNRTFEAIQVCICGGTPFWLDPDDGEVHFGSIPAPFHTKYLGDGAMWLWRIGSDGLSSSDIDTLLGRLTLLRKNFHRVVDLIKDGFPIQRSDLPSRIRFGLSSGAVYQLRSVTGAPPEYFGYAINLASRLQNYCDGICLIAGRIPLSKDKISAGGYIAKTACALKGLPKEEVIVHAEELSSVTEEIRIIRFSDQQQ